MDTPLFWSDVYNPVGPAVYQAEDLAGLTVRNQDDWDEEEEDEDWDDEEEGDDDEDKEDDEDEEEDWDDEEEDWEA
jgi:hypothetical protein